MGRLEIVFGGGCGVYVFTSLSTPDFKTTLQHVDRFFNIVSCEECRVVGYRYGTNLTTYAHYYLFLVVEVCHVHRRARLLKQQTSITVYCLPRKANFFFRFALVLFPVYIEIRKTELYRYT
jgi:hypothetical protein